MLNRTQMPTIKNAIDMNFVLPEIQNKILANGLPFYFYSGGEEPVFLLEIMFPCGTWCETKRLQTMTFSNLLKQGTKTMDSKKFNNTIEFYGANLNLTYDYETMNISLSGLTKYLKTLLPLIVEMIQAPAFEPSEFELFIKRAKQNMIINLQKADFVANQLFDAEVFGEANPYGRYSTIENYDELKLEDLIYYFDSFFSLADAKIFLSGKLENNDIEDVKNIFENADVSKKSKLPTWDFDIKPSSNFMIRKNDVKKDALQGAVSVGKQTLDMYHPDYFKLILFNTVLGGYFGSRLMTNIREDKGYTYGVYSSVMPYNHASLFKIQTDVNVNVMDDTIAQILKEIDILKTEKIDEEELLVVKNYLLSSILSRLDGPLNIMKRWKALLKNDFGIDRFNKSIMEYKTITADDIQNIAIKYFENDSLYKMTVS